MASHYYYIKLYNEILDDPKMGRLSDGAFRLCINLFLLANRQDERDGRLPDFEDIKWLLRLSDDEFDQYWGELERVNIVTVTKSLRMVTHFEKRQSAQTDAEKQKRYRQRKRKKSLQDELPDGDVPVTGDVTNGNTDIDKSREDKEKSKEKYIYDPLLEKIQPLRTALSSVVRETDMPGFDEQKYIDAAEFLFGNDVEPSEVAAFGDWWKTNGWHNGKPVLKNVINNWADFKAGICLKENKNGRITEPEPAEQRVGGAY